MSPIELSVVVAAKNNPPSLLDCLQSLHDQSRGLSVEVILATDTDLPASVQQTYPDIRIVKAAHALTPILWKLGYDASAGSAVAFTIAQCIPVEGWVQAVLRGLDGSSAGVGGPILNPDSNGTLRDWALYFARYSAFMPPGTAGTVQEIAGDNAAYKRDALEAASDAMAGGFWETLVHHRMRQQDQTLCWEPTMSVRLASSDPLMTIARLRFQHGRYYASTRPGNTLFMRLTRAISSPLLVSVLLSRIVNRVRKQHPEWQPYLLRTLPSLIVIATGWSMGEAVGYLFPSAR